MDNALIKKLIKMTDVQKKTFVRNLGYAEFMTLAHGYNKLDDYSKILFHDTLKFHLYGTHPIHNVLNLSGNISHDFFQTLNNDDFFEFKQVYLSGYYYFQTMDRINVKTLYNYCNIFLSKNNDNDFIYKFFNDYYNIYDRVYEYISPTCYTSSKIILSVMLHDHINNHTLNLSFFQDNKEKLFTEFNKVLYSFKNDVKLFKQFLRIFSDCIYMDYDRYLNQVKHLILKKHITAWPNAQLAFLKNNDREDINKMIKSMIFYKRIRG